MKHLSLFFKISPYLILLIFIVVSLFLFKIDISVYDIRQTVKQAGAFGPFVFVLLYSLTYIIAPLSGTPFFLSGFALFGDNFIFYIYFAAVIGMTVNFYLARIFGRRLVERIAGRENFEKIMEFTKNFGLKTLIFLRLFQGNVADYISLAYGLTPIKFLPYLVVSMLAPVFSLSFWFFVILPRIKTYEEFLIISGLSFLPAMIVSVAIVVRTLIYRNRRRFIVVYFFKNPLDTPLRKIREEFEADVNAKIPPHISLSYPFYFSGKTQELITKITKCAAEIKSFHGKILGMGVFDKEDGKKVIYARIGEEEPFIKLHEKIMAALGRVSFDTGIFPAHKLPEKFVPHATLVLNGKIEDEEIISKMLEKIRDKKFKVNAIALLKSTSPKNLWKTENTFLIHNS